MMKIEVLPNDTAKERTDRHGRIYVYRRRTWLLVVDDKLWGEFSTKTAATDAGRAAVLTEKANGARVHQSRPEATSKYESMSDEELVALGLSLARRFYKSHGYNAPEGFKFYESPHPEERGMWSLAVIAFAELTGTDLEDALTNTDE